jgi:hypothetical protein
MARLSIKLYHISQWVVTSLPSQEYSTECHTSTSTQHTGILKELRFWHRAAAAPRMERRTGSFPAGDVFSDALYRCSSSSISAQVSTSASHSVEVRPEDGCYFLSFLASFTSSSSSFLWLPVFQLVSGQNRCFSLKTFPAHISRNEPGSTLVVADHLGLLLFLFDYSSESEAEEDSGPAFTWCYGVA